MLIATFVSKFPRIRSYRVCQGVKTRCYNKESSSGMWTASVDDLISTSK